MVAFAAIRAGEAFVLLYAEDKLTPVLDRIEARLKGFGTNLLKMSAAIGGIGAGVAIGLAPAVKAASDLAETDSKLDQVFGGSARSARQWADNFGREVGRSQASVRAFLSDAQGLIVPMGVDEQGAAEISKTMTRLAVDLASFNNTSDESAFLALRSGITGESEPLKRYGILLTEAATKAQLLEQNIDPKNATSAEKVYARLAIITAATSAAQGDATRTAGSMVNQVKALSAAGSDLAATIGEAVMPVVLPLTRALTTGVRTVADFAKEHETLVKVVAIAATVVVGLTAAAAALLATLATGVLLLGT